MRIDTLYHSFFFIGIAGTGMSAIAQYLCGEGKTIAGSDRLFEDQSNPLLKRQLEQLGVACYKQDASGINEQIDVVVVSTAIEPTNPEYQKALELGIPVLTRAELLADIANCKKTIAVGGTSGKSTTTAMLFHVLQACGIDCSLITGAGLLALQKKDLPGNAWNGKDEWLVIEADESDGSIVHYQPEIGVLLNMDRDHKELNELHQLFAAFKAHTKSHFIVNRDNPESRKHTQYLSWDFGIDQQAGVKGMNFQQRGLSISFLVDDVAFSIPVIGRHNMENALAVVAVTRSLGLTDSQVAEALDSYLGLYRRTQYVGEKNGVVVIDDFAHNPAEVSAAIASCQLIGKRVLAWFQPHGFGPLRFMHEDLSAQVSQMLRKQDLFLLAPVYYAGGTVTQDIQSDVVRDAIVQQGKTACYVASKEESIHLINKHAIPGDVILLMGARDPYLGDFAQAVFSSL